MSTPPLTERQAQALDFIRRYMRDHHMPPTLAEIGEALSIQSSNGVYKLLQALEKKGHIEREKYVARGIRLVDEDPSAQGGELSLPVISRTPSHRPDRLRDRPEDHLTIDEHLLPAGSDPNACLLARLEDDGMYDDGIRRGDLALVEEMPQDELRDESLVGCILQEKILARTFSSSDGGYLHLDPSASHYSEKVFAPDDSDCHIIGPVRALLRMFD